MSNKRETLSQPSLESMQYCLLEQKGEENLYKFTGTKKASGELMHLIGTAEELNSIIGEQVVAITIDLNCSQSED